MSRNRNLGHKRANRFFVGFNTKTNRMHIPNKINKCSTLCMIREREEMMIEMIRYVRVFISYL